MFSVTTVCSRST